VGGTPHYVYCFLFYFFVKFGEAFFYAVPKLTGSPRLIRSHCGQCDVLSLGVLFVNILILYVVSVLFCAVNFYLCKYFCFVVLCVFILI
jgi:hypothetical protein